ncbi:IucA/IucC family protein [Francisella sp. LA112445]|uniref:IucA/IucC family protein n=1 Tax=Francisella sp. LA112445 TaxID=1395624 RepID=UPI001788E15E|nr:IucA/IucC family protein [Francisella sp. LA112445]QIW10930.1 transposase [Francisella sp. LA112445]
MIKYANEITLKNFLNCYYREFNDYTLVKNLDDGYQFSINLDSIESIFEISLKISPILKSPTWQLPCYLIKQGIRSKLDPLEAVLLIIRELNGSNELIERVSDSTINITSILQKRKHKLDRSFGCKSSFILNEQNLIRGHRQQPDPKSRRGLSLQEFIKYSPETNGKLQLHYMYVDKNILETHSLLDKSVNHIFLDFLTNESIPIKQDKNYELFALHPWQAKYLAEHDEIKKYKVENKIIDIGVMGPWFYPTTSVRTLYSPDFNIMLKFSLSIAITNSVRINLAKECARSLSVHKLYKNHLKPILAKEFPYFNLITDPAFSAIKINNKIFDPSICIIRNSSFNPQDDVACIASLTEPNPFSERTRICSLILYLSVHNNMPTYDAAIYWFETYLSVAITPILWLYSKYGIALEAHQQNLLVKLEHGLPIESYYRDSQGYYYIKDHFGLKEANFGDISNLCEGSREFIDHHFCYYFIVNQLMSVIEAIANTGYISERDLIKVTTSFLEGFAEKYQACNKFINKILKLDQLPLKANLRTRLDGLDELQAPLTSQSIYVNTNNNPFKEVI